MWWRLISKMPLIQFQLGLALPLRWWEERRKLWSIVSSSSSRAGSGGTNRNKPAQLLGLVDGLWGPESNINRNLTILKRSLSAGCQIPKRKYNYRHIFTKKKA